MSNIDKAREMGRERGKAAASWVFDGNTTQETYRAFLQWNEDGDPRIEQFDPRTGWLSGEYGDEPSPTTLARDLGLPTETDDDMNAVDEVCNVYEEAAEDAYWAELERVARLQIDLDIAHKNHAPCPNHEGQEFNKSTGACSCGSSHKGG